jgi:leader peptidase (prepilin peptidase)/N-methyltransferase
VLLSASLIGLAAVLGMMSVGRRVRATDRLPFGVMLAAGAWVIWFGHQLYPAPAPAEGILQIARTAY